jgi:hypothetical protein
MCLLKGPRACAANTMAVYNSPYAASIRHIILVASPFLIIAILFFGLNRSVISDLWTQSVTPPASPVSEVTAQEQCIDKTIARLRLEAVDWDFYQRIWTLCGNEEYNRFYLLDFKIRRKKLLEQGFDERVTLAMVVAITISGVLMSGLQLFMSYRLAMAGHTELGKDIELSLQKDKIALKSSIVGLAILIISLAFFVVYVKYIYTITEIPVDTPRPEPISGHQLPFAATVPVPIDPQGNREKQPAPSSTESQMPTIPH